MTEKHEKLLEAFIAGLITDSEREELASLIEADEKFAAVFREYEQAYALACVPEFEKTKDREYCKISSRIARPRRRVSAWGFSLGAGFASLLLLLGAFFLQQRTGIFDPVQNVTVTANNGTGTQTVLPDGSRVRLNAESALSFGKGFGRRYRDVSLNGEGYFDVAPDSKKPFRVHVSDVCITVTGTNFNVRSYSDESEIAVSLFQGSVVLDTPSSQISLAPGDCAMIRRGDGTVNVVGVEPSASAWTKGRFVFTDRSIPQILRSVERNYGVCFVYDDNLFASERFTGVLSFSLSIDEILSCIDVDRKYGWTRQDSIIRIFKKNI